MGKMDGAIGRPQGRNYPILSNDAYREGWERIFGSDKLEARESAPEADAPSGLKSDESAVVNPGAPPDQP